MSIVPGHPIWKRTRKPHHGGAFPDISIDDVDVTPRGPGSSPLYCKECDDLNDSGSSGYLSSPQSKQVFFKGIVHVQPDIELVQLAHNCAQTKFIILTITSLLKRE